MREETKRLKTALKQLGIGDSSGCCNLRVRIIRTKAGEWSHAESHTRPITREEATKLQEMIPHSGGSVFKQFSIIRSYDADGFQFYGV